MTAGRPPKYTDAEIKEIVKDLEDYIERTADPTIVGFTAYYKKHPVNKTYMTERSEFANLVKRAVEKQEAYILAGVMQNKLNATMGIFRLKQPQHGYSDKQQIEEKSDQTLTIRWDDDGSSNSIQPS